MGAVDRLKSEGAAGQEAHLGRKFHTHYLLSPQTSRTSTASRVRALPSSPRRRALAVARVRLLPWSLSDLGGSSGTGWSSSGARQPPVAAIASSSS